MTATSTRRRRAAIGAASIAALAAASVGVHATSDPPTARPLAGTSEPGALVVQLGPGMTATVDCAARLRTARVDSGTVDLTCGGTTTSSTTSTTGTTATTAPATTGTTATTAPATTSTTTTAPPPLPPPVLDLPVAPGQVGPDYWSRFPKAVEAGWANPAFFPIVVWYESAYNAAPLKALGINTVIPNHDGAPLHSIGEQTGMFFLPNAPEFQPAEVGASRWVPGWENGLDECDMLCANPVQDMAARTAAIRARNDGRFVYGNFGKGVLGTWWNPQNLPAMVQANDVASGDLYFYTDPNLPNEAPLAPTWPPGAGVRRAGSYGWTVDRMETFDSPEQPHPVWNFVEVGHPAGESWTPTITPDQAEGAVWASIIAGGRGIVYFNHSFGGSCQSQHVLFDCNPAMRDRIAAVNAKVTALAPALNSPTLAYTPSAGATSMVKVHDGNLWIVAGVGHTQQPGAKTFTLPAGISADQAEVVGEGRTVPIVGGQFTDTFAAEWSHHVYRVPLG